MLDEVQCMGTEASLADCKSLGWLKSNCRHERDAGVVCTNGEHLPAEAPACPGVPGPLPLPAPPHTHEAHKGSFRYHLPTPHGESWMSKEPTSSQSHSPRLLHSPFWRNTQNHQVSMRNPSVGQGATVSVSRTPGCSLT